MSSADNPATRITLFRLVSPDAIVMEERGTSKRFAKNSMQAPFARPSVGGAVKASFIALPTSPIRAFFLARGFTLTAKVAPAGVSRIGITNYNSTTDRRGPVTLRLCGNYLLGLSPKIAVPTRTQ